MSSNLSVSGALDASGASVLSSTAIDGANFSPANLDVSSIESEVFFCQKCGQIFQKYVPQFSLFNALI